MEVLNCKIGFQDLVKALNLAKMHIEYWKSKEIRNAAIYLFKFILYRWWQFCRCFLEKM